MLSLGKALTRVLLKNLQVGAPAVFHNGGVRYVGMSWPFVLCVFWTCCMHLCLSQSAACVGAWPTGLDSACAGLTS